VIRRTLRIGLVFGILAGMAVAVARVLGWREQPGLVPARSPEPWPPLSTPDPAPPEGKPPAAPWVDPVDGACPTSHPVKAKLSSKIFHVRGMGNYERTNPDRCYVDAATAEDDGLRPAKR